MEQHEFETDKNLIVHFIKSQAGSLSKALLEYVQNSGDAKATQVAITIDRDGFTVVDDGEGMPTRELILEVFNRFGFDHSNHDRQWGRFGLGRAQGWNYAKTLFKTHNFALDVDIRERGLKWLLHTDCKHQPGLVIEGKFYEPLSAVDQADTIRDMARMCRYLDMSVIINGEQVNRAPSTQKWTEECDSYYLSANDSNYLHVYNMGVFVCDIYAGQAGVGGTIVTKAGHALTLNVARNDIMRNACTVWPAISKRLREIGQQRAGAASPTQRKTDADRDFMASRTADPAEANAFEGAMFTLSTGRHITLQRMELLCRGGATLTTAVRGNSIAERLYRAGSAIPLAEVTLERFGVRDISGFKAELLRRLKSNHSMTAAIARSWWMHPYKNIETAEVCETIEGCKGYKKLDARIIPDNELSKADLDTLRAIRSMSYAIAKQVEAALESTSVEPRDIVMGQSGDALAYTDGETYIAVVDTFVKACVRDGLGGFHRLANVLVHEYIHNTADVGSHSHDPEFMETFHEVMVRQGVYVAAAATEAFRMWTKAQARLSKARARELDGVI